MIQFYTEAGFLSSQNLYFSTKENQNEFFFIIEE